MINIIDKHNCCGCNACAQRCPKQCISMKADIEGFLYPEVDKDYCIDCGLCEKVCPEINGQIEKQPIEVIGAKLKDKNIVYNSSSGGIFTYLANKILDEKGVVFGVRFDNEWNVIHDYTETKEGLAPFCKSKYVQSYIGNSFKIAESFLKDGRKVLFTGTPCQIKALKLFLRKDYKELLTVDVACHGVPSPKVWKIYIDDFCKRHSISKDNIVKIDFRDKSKNWQNYSFTIDYIKDKEKYVETCYHWDNIYMKAFLSNLSLRKSCEKCNAKMGKSGSDLTIADFWGVGEIKPDFYEDTGVSLVLVNSNKGLDYMNLKSIEYVKTDFDSVIIYNAGLRSDLKIYEKRDKYFEGLDVAKDFISYTNKFFKKKLSLKIKSRLSILYKKIKNI